jgi:dihydroorotate dehydrogenase (NAD+) catalytic subunit
MDEDAGSMFRIFNAGAGAVVTKSIGLKKRYGYPNPTFVELDHGILNAMGLPNPGIEEFGNEILKLKKKGVIVIGSIYGSNPSDFKELAKKMESYKCDAIELNMSCPHAKNFGLEIGCDPDLVFEITKHVKKSIILPVFVKISSNLTDIIQVARAIENAGADAVVAINTIKAMKIDIDLKMPVLSNQTGGYSGKAIKPIGVRCVYDISKELKIPIIGVGGITNGSDVIEYIMAGATCVQIGTGVYYRGIEIFKKICDEISKWMGINDINKLSSLIGVAHK